MSRKFLAILTALFLACVRMSASNKADYMLPLVYTLNRINPGEINIFAFDKSITTFEEVLAGDAIPLPIGVRPPSNMFPRIQYKIACGSKINQAPTQVPRDVVAQKLAYTKCHNFLKPPKITLSSKGVNVERTLTPVPAYQMLRGFELTDNDPGINLNMISSCCSPSACPESCIDTPQSQCRLELYGPMIYDGSNTQTIIFNGIENFFRGLVDATGDIRTNYYASMDFIMSIPCQFCKFRSCTTDCSNGQVTFLVLTCT